MQRLEQRWDELREAYAGLSDAEMTAPGVTGGWSVKDIVAHVTTWEEESLKHLPQLLAGTRPPRYSVAYGGIDAFNALTTERKRSLPLAEVLLQRDETHHRLVAFIVAMPDGEFVRETRARRRLRLDAYGHYPRHAAAIRSWRRRHR